MSFARLSHQVYESSKFAKELGAAIHIPPNAHSLLMKIGIDPVAIGANPCTRVSANPDDSTCWWMSERLWTNTVTRFMIADISGGVVDDVRIERLQDQLYRHQRRKEMGICTYSERSFYAAKHLLTHTVQPWVLGHRVKLHDALKEAATSAGATLHLSKSATRIDPHHGIVEFEDGTSAHGDVIIGADGVHSISRNLVSEKSIPFSSGKSAFRFLVPREAVLSDPQTKPYASTDGEMVIVYHADRRLVMYPTSDNSILNFVCIHPEAETASKATGDWNNDATKEMLLDVYRDFHADFKSILNKSNAESLKIWKLLDMVSLTSSIDTKI
jgi:2-polyprenyl-6-methoxyphenol hydroxylase-like FAD-dependent oxidoreductase